MIAELKRLPLKYQILFWGMKVIILILAIVFVVKLARLR